jgi:hypothetical protein
MSEHLKVYNKFKGTTRSDNMMAYFRNGKLNVHITQANVKVMQFTDYRIIIGSKLTIKENTTTIKLYF